MSYGGETGIRTLDTLSSIHAFQACAFSHSAISPLGKHLAEALAGSAMRPKRHVPGHPVAAQLHCNLLADGAQRERDLSPSAVSRELRAYLSSFSCCAR